MEALRNQFPASDFALLAVVLLLPAIGAFVNGVFGKRLGKDAVRLMALSAIGGAFLASVLTFLMLPHAEEGEPAPRLAWSVWHWFSVTGRPGTTVPIDVTFSVDAMSATMMLVVTGVGFLIHLYSTEYMREDEGFARFFAYLNLFCFAMLILIMADNLALLFVGWEGVGLCSYLLIGFWYKDYKKATAGMKAFVVNRVGDWGFICGLGLLFWGMGGKWLENGQYVSDYRERFVAVQMEQLAEEGEEGELAAETRHEKPGHEADEHEGKEHGKDAVQKAEKMAGAKGSLTFTGHPGARVYLGISDQSQLATAEPWAISPFMQKPIDAGAHSIVIVPGDGATVRGDGVEAALLQKVEVEAGKEVSIATIGSTVSFRELHDQLVLKDATGKEFLKEALKEKTTWGGIALITFACLLFFVGATGKSAQIPLYVWLPDAMAGPTPVSALIHAATMVTAGVYMIARLNFLFSLSPTAGGIIALVGAATALFAATIGFFQYDIKKVLAYSTVSQLGFMFIGVGVGAYWAGVFHLMTHAFFKACLFLGSGSVIHGMHAVEHDEVAVQDMRNMGGLRRVMPITARTYQIACLAITAAPIPFFAGFWSKDEILWKAFSADHTGAVPGVLIYLMGLTAALGTSFYMWRSYYLTFEGEHANPEIATKVKESPPAITLVLVVLAFLSTVAGVTFGLSSHLIGGHGEPVLEEWLHPVLAHSESIFKHYDLGLELLLMAMSVGGAIAMWALARSRYGAKRSPTWAADERRLPGFELLQNKYYVDEIYAKSIVRAFLGLRLVFAEMDRWIVDGLVNGIGVAARGASWVTGTIDALIVDGAVNFVAEGTLKAGERLRTVQTGRIQNYVYGLLGGVAFFAIVQYFLK